MAKKDDELVLLIDRNELEKKAQADNKLTDQDVQLFVESIMTNYFLDNDNINFLEDKGISFFTFALKEDCFCISGKKYQECCFLKLVKSKDTKYIPYIKSLLAESDYKSYVEMLREVYQTQMTNYINEVNCFYPKCENKPIKNNLYQNINNEEFLTTVAKNPFDARYKMGEAFFHKIEEDTFAYYGFCKDHESKILAVYNKTDLDDQDILLLSFEVLVYRLFKAMVHFKSSQYEFLTWYNSVEEDGYRAYMTVHMRKISQHLKGILNLFKIVSDNISSNTMLRLKVLTMWLKSTNKMICKDLVAPQVTPSDFKMVNSVNNVLITPKYMVQTMLVTKKTTKVYYLYEKLDESIYNYITQYQLKMQGKKETHEFFVSNTSLILADNILLNEKWFSSLEEQEKVLYSALNKFRYDQPDIGREYIKMQFFAGFDKGNNFF